MLEEWSARPDVQASMRRIERIRIEEERSPEEEEERDRR